jgi:hypothetical protein
MAVHFILPFFEVSRFSQLPAVASYWFWGLADISHIELLGHFRQAPYMDIY